MNCLAFARRGRIVEGRCIREACFESRSGLPVSAACLVANGVRETLGTLLGTSVALRLLEPVLPDETAWNALAAEAHVYGVRGPVADAAFVLRPHDALTLASAAFGEAEKDMRSLSAIEHEVLTRALRALAGCLSPVCGTRDLSPFERVADVRRYATYFEILIEQPAPFRLGVALSRDPQPRGAPGLRIEDLLEVEIELTVELAAGFLAAGAFLDLRVGTEVPMTTKVRDHGLLKAGASVVARGECGALDERGALIVRER